jgi:hypothetical protein
VAGAHHQAGQQLLCAHHEPDASKYYEQVKPHLIVPSSAGRAISVPPMMSYP